LRVEERDWDAPDSAEWAASLEAAVKRSGPDTVLVAHSLACLQVAHWALGQPSPSPIQAAFLVGWALGGAFFGRIGDLLGRRKALVLTILSYACFTGLSALAQNWWQLMLCRFLAALGIEGWAIWLAFYF
jgi:MFS family permease